MERLREELDAELHNELTDEIRQMVERCDDRFSLSRSHLRERHLGGTLKLHIHFAIVGDEPVTIGA